MANDHGHILVVDDYAVARLKLSHFLQQQGYTVTLAETGRQAVEVINEELFDLMLLDIMMPEMGLHGDKIITVGNMADKRAKTANHANGVGFGKRAVI